MKKKMSSIHITGIGVESDYGDTKEKFWKSLLSAQDELDGSISINTGFKDNLIQKTVKAIEKAAQDAKIDLHKENGCIILGTGVGLADQFMEDNANEDFMSYFRQKIRKYIREDIEVLIISTACSAAAQAIVYGIELLQRKNYSYVIAGGVEEISQIVQYGFERLKCMESCWCRPFDEERRGIYPGRGAVFFALEEQTEKKVYCQLAGYGVTSDAYHVISPDPSGKYAETAIRIALKDSDLRCDEIDCVIAHGTGTKLNDKIESDVLYRIFQNIDITAPKGRTGHTGGASGAFGLLTAILVLYYQTVPPIVHLNKVGNEIHVSPIRKQPKEKKIHNVLINCFAFGGTNVSIICTNQKEEYIGKEEKKNEKKKIEKKKIEISEFEYQQEKFDLEKLGTTDEYTKRILFIAKKLISIEDVKIDSNTTGVVLGTQRGPVKSLKQIGHDVAKHGYMGIMPGTFPNIMLSTPLYWLTRFAGTHGVSCGFYESGARYEDSMAYANMQIANGNCDSIVLIQADESGKMLGYFLRKTEASR